MRRELARALGIGKELARDLGMRRVFAWALGIWGELACANEAFRMHA